MNKAQPTPYPDVNAILQELLASVQAILGAHFVGMYLDGSLTGSDFDQDSDIDFVVVSDEDISSELFAALQTMHDRLATLASPWAIQLEGSYLSQQALRRYDPAHALHPNIERGPGERLKMAVHDDAWLVHLAILRQRGITLVGPAPQTLIDPVAPQDLRRAMIGVVRGWAANLLANPSQIGSRGYQSYVVLAQCRILYTLDSGTVASKRVAARWAQASLDGRWAPLIERAWAGRHQPDMPPAADDMNETLQFIRYTMERSRHYEIAMDEA